MQRLSALGLLLWVAAGMLLATSASAGSDVEPGLSHLNLKAHYHALQQAVEEGKLSKAKGRRADALWLHLRKDLIGMNARIRTQKLDIAATDGTKQQEAIEKLIKLSAMQERRLQEALRRLDRLGARPGGRHAQDIAPVPSEAPVVKQEPVKAVTQQKQASDKPRHNAQSNQSKGNDNHSATSDIQVDIGPEDVIHDPQHME